MWDKQIEHFVMLCHKHCEQYHDTAAYMGVTEASSIALAFVDLFKQFPALRARFPAVHEASRAVFAVLFISIRAVFWPCVSYYFWLDSFDQLRSTDGSAAPAWVVYFFLVCNFLLTSLQLYWANLVVQGALKVARGENDVDKDR